MNCTYCGKKLYPEAPFCPHCGKPNEHRAALERNVGAFDQSYGQTTQNVRSAVRRKNRFFGKVAVILFLIFLTALAAFFRAYGASSLAYDLRQKRTAAQIEQILAEENAYLDAEDYFGLNAYFAYRNSSSDIANAAPSYHLVNNTVRSYCDVMTYFMAYREELTGEEPYPDTLVSRASSIRNGLSAFYRDKASDNLSWYGEQARSDAVEQMTRNLEALAIACFGMPPEEAASLSALSEGAREVLLETWIQAPPPSDSQEEP